MQWHHNGLLMVKISHNSYRVLPTIKTEKMKKLNYMKKIAMAASITIFTLSSANNSFAQDIDAANDPHIESHVKVFLKAVNTSGGKPIEELSPKDGRAVLTSVNSSVKVDLSGIEVTEKTINTDGLTIKLNIVRPKGVTGILPVFMFFHGGGWVLGDFPTHERLVRDLVHYSGAVAVFVNYSRSPEVKFPVAINQAYAATKWVASNGKSIGVDGSRLAVVGNSVGGNMAAVVALMAKDKKGPSIKFQVLMWPVTDANFETESYNKFATQRFLTKTVMQYYWNSYTNTTEERANIYASPLKASLEELSGLPPALIQTAENDVLRDEGEAYARKLDQAGVPVSWIRLNGLIHDYGLLNPLANVPNVKTAMLQAATEIKYHLK